MARCHQPWALAHPLEAAVPIALAAEVAEGSIAAAVAAALVVPTAPAVDVEEAVRHPTAAVVGRWDSENATVSGSCPPQELHIASVPVVVLKENIIV